MAEKGRKGGKKKGTTRLETRRAFEGVEGFIR
jgi:hypothetical protein